MIKKKKKKKKAWDLGSSRNHLSSFIHYTFNLKHYYLTSTNQDLTVLYEPSDQRCYIGVKGPSYRNSHQGLKEVIVRKLSVTCCKYHPARRGLNNKRAITDFDSNTRGNLQKSYNACLI